MMGWEGGVVCQFRGENQVGRVVCRFWGENQVGAVDVIDIWVCGGTGLGILRNQLACLWCFEVLVTSNHMYCPLKLK